MPAWAIALVVVFSVLAFGIIVTLLSGIRIVPQTSFYVIERLGSYRTTWENGLHWKAPIIDRIALKNDAKEKVFDFPAQPVITKDNAIIMVDSVIFLKITDPKKFAYGAQNPFKAIENLAATTLRNLLGELDLDKTLTSRETVNGKLAAILDEATDPWGIKVFRVELKNIQPPNDIQNAMEKQLRAEREKRANILSAEGFKSAAILEAEGKRTAAILNAEAIKESSILEAEGQKKSFELINSVDLNERLLTWKAIESIKFLAEGNATKIIIPPNIKDLAGSMASLGEIVESAKVNPPKKDAAVEKIVKDLADLSKVK